MRISTALHLEDTDTFTVEEFPSGRRVHVTSSNDPFADTSLWFGQDVDGLAALRRLRDTLDAYLGADTAGALAILRASHRAVASVPRNDVQPDRQVEVYRSAVNRATAALLGGTS